MPNPEVKREREKIVALGLGAGLNSREMSNLTWGDVEVDEVGVLIHVGERVIPMYEKYVYLLLVAGETHTAGEYVLRPNRTCREPDEITGRTMRNDYDCGLRPQVKALRVTWIVQALRDGIPDAVICQCAGIKTMKAFEKYRPDIDASTVRTMRRMVHRAENADGSTGLTAV